MKFNFKIQQYQTDAVENAVNVKKMQMKGFEVKNLKGTSSYL